MSLLGTLTPDNLIAGDAKIVTDEVTILSSAALARGTVLGKVTVGAATSAVKAGNNTGNGTLTLDATAPKQAGVQTGVYKVRVIRAAVAAVGETSTAMEAILELKDPSGRVLEVFDLPTTPGITIINQIKFAILEGVTPFVLGDGFDITVAVAAEKYLKLDKAAIDGSAEPAAILLAAADASEGDVTHAPVALTGEFSSAALIFASGTVIADVKAKMRAVGLFVKTIVTNP